MTTKQRLHQYLLGLDTRRVSKDDPKNQMLEQDVMSIVNKALAKVTEKDNRLQFTVHGSGSFYDGVKVGSPDEFDCVAEITTLQGKSVTFSPTDDPGFVQIKLTTQEQRRRWKDCLIDPKELLQSNAKREMFHCFEGESNPFPTYKDKKKKYKGKDYSDDSNDSNDSESPDGSNDSDSSDDSYDHDDSDDSDYLYDPYHNFQNFDSVNSYSSCSEDEEYISDDMILAPTKLQTKFKLLFDEVMSKIDLPANWEHGGYQRPQYSGCRRHGPATMIMLVYRNQDEEIKINVDVTIGIPVPFPVDFKRDLNMNVFENVKFGSIMEEILKDAMKYGPSIHLIPLYAKMLVKTRRYSNKFSYRISCSSLEKYILNCWEDDAGPKKCFRILKVIRDKYFAEGIRKTHRKKKMTKRRECINVEDPTKLGQATKDTRPGHMRPKKKPGDKNHLGKNNIDKNQSEKPEMTATEYASRINIAHQDWAQEMLRNEQILKKDRVFNKETNNKTKVFDREESCDQNNRNTTRNTIGKFLFCGCGSQSQESGIDVNSMSQADSDLEMGASGIGETDLCVSSELADKLEESNIDAVSKQKPTTSGVTWKAERMSMIGHINFEQNDTTDLTEIDVTIEKRTKEEAFKKFQITRHQYQSEDIADMTYKPGSGEYYGPRTYMASIEIKTYILRLLGTKWDPENWTDEKVCEYIEEFMKTYHTLLLKETMIKNFFFDTLVCSPISEEQRLKALENFNVLQKDFNDIMEGKVKSNA